MLIHTPKNLALFLRDYRKRNKLSQTEAGQIVGLKQQTISEFETHPESKQVETLFRILAALNLDMYLVSRDEDLASSERWEKEW